MSSEHTPESAAPNWWPRLLRWLRGLVTTGSAGGRDDGDEFAEELLRDVAQHLASRAGGSRAELETELLALRRDPSATPGLSGVRRVDCTITKASATKASVTVRVLQVAASAPALLTLARECGWDELPREVRAGFIRQPIKEQVFVVIERSQSNREDN